MQIDLTRPQFDAFLNTLYDRDDRLDLRSEGQVVPRDEIVDAYDFSAHVEALNVEEFDGELWSALEDIDETADTEEEAWNKIKAFYLDRGCLLLRVEDTDEWIVSEALARRLNLAEAARH